MSFELLMNKLQTLSWSVEALAALSAELRLRLEGHNGDSRVLSLLRDVLDRIEPGLLDGIAKPTRWNLAHAREPLRPRSNGQLLLLRTRGSRAADPFQSVRAAGS